MALNVKVGDKVIYHTNGSRGIATVTKVTPTGRIRIDASMDQFTPDGDKMGQDLWEHCYITVYDETVAQEIKNEKYVKNVIARMRKISANDLTVEDAKAIMAIIQKYQTK